MYYIFYSSATGERVKHAMLQNSMLCVFLVEIEKPATFNTTEKMVAGYHDQEKACYAFDAR